jgi:hypothetical protein
MLGLRTNPLSTCICSAILTYRIHISEGRKLTEVSQPDRVPSFSSAVHTETQPTDQYTMEYQSQTPALDSLMVAKKRKDSGADNPSPQSPASSGTLNRRLESSSVAYPIVLQQWFTHTQPA